ncbi:MAG: hypothetical protein LBR80_05100 [Deltaproteobacteria bacterium]|jgi:hypothetical protein|nr:hypothetical protein [Deltaproteobacteria bacterium]
MNLITFLKVKTKRYGNPEGKTFELDLASSFWEKLGTAETFRGEKDGILIEVVSAKGIPIRTVSVHSQEFEHLFAYGSVFKVKNVWREKKDSYGEK